MSETIHYERGADGIAVLTFDDPNQTVNTMNAAYAASMDAAVNRLEAETEDIKGVVVTSAKGTFFVGGDLNELRRVPKHKAEEFAARAREGRGMLRRLETLGKPVVAAINGAALGAGLEICLACHHRVIVDDPEAVVGFPDVTLGLSPAAGGVARSVRTLGIIDALTRLLLKGQRLRPAEALELGIVDEIVPARDELLSAARAWIESQGDTFTGQPWDVPEYRIPGGVPSDPSLVATLAAFPAGLRKQLKGANYPAPHHIMAAAVEGAQVDVDTAFEIEGRYFVDLVTGQVAKNMIQASFFDLQRVTGERGRGPDVERHQFKKVVVLGSGMMGAAIAYACANAGIDVVLKDVSDDTAERGKDYSRKLVAKGIEGGTTTQEKGEGLLARITPTADARAADGADLVIEAVFEDPRVKAEVMREIEPHLAGGALLGSNTSTLPITGLAENVMRPGDFIGLHFFSPADKMPLLEIIKGEQTREMALYRALDLARQIGKTPIVVNDSRGFFTSRVIGTFIAEGIAMLTEGIPAASVEQACSQAGYPVPVLQLSDELNMKLLRRIRTPAKVVPRAESVTHPAEGVIDRMLDEFHRPGKLEGAGFYEYEDGKRARLWPGLHEAFPPVDDAASIVLKDLEERMLFIEALETVKCLDEGVLESVADANIGSIMGIGFPGWTGGVLQYINGYERGAAGFVTRAHELAQRYGHRFEPPTSLIEKAERGEAYSDEHSLVAA